MAKYVLVKKRPEKLDKDCFVIDAPNFIEEIAACKNKKPRSGNSSINYLREIVSLIGAKYAPDDFSPLRDVNVSMFKGTPCSSDFETNKVLFKIFKKSYPEIFDMYVDFYIKKRPPGTKLIYFLGSHLFSAKFYENGIDEISFKKINEYLGKSETKNNKK